MVASGSEDFENILGPLLRGNGPASDIVDIGVLRNFRASSLGADWRTVVSGWPEDARLRFVREALEQSKDRKYATELAQSDPSVKVKAAAALVILRLGDEEVFEDALGEDNDNVISEMLRQGARAKEFPGRIRAKAIAKLRKGLDGEEKPVARIMNLHSCIEAGYKEGVSEIKTLLDGLQKEELKDLGNLRLASVLPTLQEDASDWVDHWLVAHVMDGSLRATSWVEKIRSFKAEPLVLGIEEITDGRSDDRRAADLADLICAAAETEGLVDTVFSHLTTLAAFLSKPTEGPSETSTCPAGYACRHLLYPPPESGIGTRAWRL